jgi:hypothetical protein
MYFRDPFVVILAHVTLESMFTWRKRVGFETSDIKPYLEFFWDIYEYWKHQTMTIEKPHPCIIWRRGHGV